MSDRREYDRHYYHSVRQPKTAASKAVAAALCQLCGDDWAREHVGWNDAVFVCGNCNNKLSTWEREKELERRKMDALCQVCYIEPAESLHEASSLRCCVGCLVWLSEGEAEGSQRWKPAENPWDEDGKLGHIFDKVTQFHEPPAATALCGVKAPVWPIAGDMFSSAAVKRFGLCVACFQACPDPAYLFHPRHEYFAYVVPTDVVGRIAPAVGTS